MDNLLILSSKELLEKVGLSLGVLAILDFGLTYHSKARYFLLHGIWNIIITLVLIPDLVRVVLDPFNCFDITHEYNNWPVIMVATLHFWHCIAYTGLTRDDYFHHFLFAGTLVPINLIWNWGYSTNFFVFFICGFPGGLDYLMLAAVKHGYIRKIDEKRWNRMLNIWCRSPGCIATSCLLWMNWMSGNTSHIPFLVKIIVMFLAFFNGKYYEKRVIVSWVNHEKEYLSNSNSS